MKYLSTIIVVLCAAVIVSSLFMPYYEGSRNNSVIKADSPAVIETYELPEIGILFVFNGFGSFIGISCLVLAGVLCFTHFSDPRSLIAPAMIGVLFCCLILLAWFGSSAGFGRPIPDRMLQGFYLTIIGMTALIAHAFVQAIVLRKAKRS